MFVCVRDVRAYVHACMFACLNCDAVLKGGAVYNFLLFTVTFATMQLSTDHSID